jgi:hypothetical protein
MTCKSSITKSEYLQLIGLLVLAKGHNDNLKELAKAIREITGESHDQGHSTDAAYCDYSADDLLQKLEIPIP